jgi:hypothetical protein
MLKLEAPSADDLDESIDLPDRPEAAIHLRPNAPGGTEDGSDGYVQGETT